VAPPVSPPVALICGQGFTSCPIGDGPCDLPCSF
jgi:hypothetical protein